MKQWEAVELKLPPFQKANKKIRKMICLKLTALSFLVLSLGSYLQNRSSFVSWSLYLFSFFSVEHVLSFATIIQFIVQCYPQKDKMAEILKIQFPNVFLDPHPSIWALICGKFVNINATFVWNYMDVFIIIMSLGLLSMFQQINEDLKRIRGKVFLFL